MTVSLDRRSLLGAGAASAAAVGLGTGAKAKAVLAPGVKKADFKGAVAAMRKVVGDEWVFADPEAVAPWKKSYTPDPYGKHVPVGAVCPENVEQVQAIVKIANQFRQPIWPVSTGKNMGYGQTTTAMPGQMILDLKRMNRIISVDPELCTALVEPGVTYRQLKDYLVENNLPLWIDVPTVGPVVGPVGNTLDRGVGYTPYGEHFMVQCGMEVVLADGEILRTGMGSTRNPSAWQAFKWGYGPYLDGLFTQSNFGVVTKMGMWLMPAPPVYKPFVIRHRKMEDVARIVEAMRPLRIANIVPNVVLMMGGAYQLAMFKRRGEVWDGAGPITDEAVSKAATANNLGMWNTYIALYGTEGMIAESEKIIRAAFAAIDGEVLTEAEMGDNPWFHHHATLMQGGLNLDEIGLARWRGNGGGLAWFAPVAPAKGSETQGQVELAKQILGKHGFDYTAAFAIGSRELHHIIALLYDKSDPAEEKRADDCYRELVTGFGERGWASYRTGVHAMDLVAQQFGAVNRAFNAKLKDALDPNHILAPGKSGIA
ncbi:FAD-binding oxidoreductase [Novosphingobium sp.]|uniref:FAD-binding oxidoreductase n=1 Tax=Novosphingobium sp. TaxID=1874826 RepID=UPI001DF47895|nr:FAD-binding oxidoreductase [Novosphingobium sp.]MBX9662717.1 FAD-binding oxidoreductase [Novosphingobium sp.]